MEERPQSDARLHRKHEVLQELYRKGELPTTEYYLLRSLIEKDESELGQAERTILGLFEEYLDDNISYGYFFNSLKLLGDKIEVKEPAARPAARSLASSRQGESSFKITLKDPHQLAFLGLVLLAILLLVIYHLFRPDAPSDLAVTRVKSTSVEISWQDNSMLERGFEVERNIGGNLQFEPVATTASNITVLVDSGLQTEQTYAYRVRAFNLLGHSGFSNETIVITREPIQPPAAPSGLLAVQASASQIDLSWTDESDDEASFAIERSSNSDTGFSEIGKARVNALKYSDRGLEPGTTHYYRIRALNEAGPSLYSNTVSAQTAPPPRTAPAAPARLEIIRASIGRVDLIWEDRSQNEEGFQVERSVEQSANFGRVANLPAGAVSCSDSTTKPSTTYHYRVRASNRVGHSAFSKLVTVMTPPIPEAPPEKPSSLQTFKVGHDRVELRWRDNSRDEEAFLIERSSDGGVVFSPVAQTLLNTTAYLDSGLFPTTTYHYRIKAVNVAGESGYSKVVKATTHHLPGLVPGELKAKPRSSSEIELTWNNVPGVSEINLERSPSASANFAPVVTLQNDETAYVDKGLPAGQTFFYRLKSEDSAGKVTYSKTVEVETAAARQLLTPPAAPSGLSATRVSSTQIDLAWRDRSGDERGYRIQRRSGRREAFETVATTKPNVTSWSDKGLAPDRTYTYRVIAFNDAGTSAASEEVQATTGRYRVVERQGERFVIDLDFDLMWQQSGSPRFMSYEEARQYLAALNRRRAGGYSDWRLPAQAEASALLESIPKNDDLYISEVFDATQRWIWTSTRRAPDSGTLVVNFSTRTDQSRAQTSTHLNYVRAVRSME